MHDAKREKEKEDHLRERGKKKGVKQREKKGEVDESNGGVESFLSLPHTFPFFSLLNHGEAQQQNAGPAAPGDPGHGQRHAADGACSQLEWTRGFDSERKAEGRCRAGGAVRGGVSLDGPNCRRSKQKSFLLLPLQSARHVPRRDARHRFVSSAPTWRAWNPPSSRGAQKLERTRGGAQGKRENASNQSTCAALLLLFDSPLERRQRRCSCFPVLLLALPPSFLSVLTCWASRTLSNRRF